MTLEEDWERVKNAYLKVKNAHWNPPVLLYVEPKELRKADNRGIDFAIRRLLDSKEYSYLIRLYGAPTSLYPRNPFCYNATVWALIKIDTKGKPLFKQ